MNNDVVSLKDDFTLDEKPKEKDIFEKLTAISLNILHWEAAIQVQNKTTPGVKSGRMKKYRNSVEKYQLYPKAAVNFYYRARNAVLSLLNEIGFEFMGFWVFPSGMIKYVHKEMLIYQKEYMNHVELIKENHDMYITSWKQSHPDKISLLKKDKHSLQNILKKFEFSWYFFKISLVDNHFFRQSFLTEVDKIDYYVYKSMAQKAHHMWRDIFSKKTPCLAESVEHFRVFRDKMKGLSFINPHRFEALAKLIDVFLSQTPAKGKLSIEEYNLVQKLTLLFKNVENCSKCTDLILKADMTLPTLIKVVDKLVKSDLEEHREEWGNGVQNNETPSS